jgi:uncharacterized protein YjiS (DUF1127 family)
MATVAHTSFAAANIAERFNAFVADIKAALELHAKYRATVYELEGLSTRELADLGLTAADITRVAAEHVYGK